MSRRPKLPSSSRWSLRRYATDSDTQLCIIFRFCTKTYTTKRTRKEMIQRNAMYATTLDNNELRIRFVCITDSGSNGFFWNWTREKTENADGFLHKLAQCLRLAYTTYSYVLRVQSAHTVYFSILRIFVFCVFLTCPALIRCDRITCCRDQ